MTSTMMAPGGYSSLNNTSTLVGSTKDTGIASPSVLHALDEKRNTEEWLRDMVTTFTGQPVVNQELIQHKIEVFMGCKLIHEIGGRPIETAFGLIFNHAMSREPIAEGFKLSYVYNVDLTDAAGTSFLGNNGPTVHILEIKRVIANPTPERINIKVDKILYQKFCDRLRAYTGAALSRDKQIAMGMTPPDDANLVIPHAEFKAFESQINVRLQAAASAIVRGNNVTMLGCVIRNSPPVYSLPLNSRFTGVMDRYAAVFRILGVVPQFSFGLNKFIVNSNGEERTPISTLAEVLRIYSAHTDNSGALKGLDGWIEGKTIPFTKPDAVVVTTTRLIEKLVRLGVCKYGDADMNQIMTAVVLDKQDMNPLHTVAPDMSVKLENGSFEYNPQHNLRRAVHKTRDVKITYSVVDGKNLVFAPVDDGSFSKDISNSSEITTATTFDFMMPSGIVPSRHGGEVNLGPCRQSTTFTNEMGQRYDLTCAAMEKFLRLFFTPDAESIAYHSDIVDMQDGSVEDNLASLIFYEELSAYEARIKEEGARRKKKKEDDDDGESDTDQTSQQTPDGGGDGDGPQDDKKPKKKKNKNTRKVGSTYVRCVYMRNNYYYDNRLMTQNVISVMENVTSPAFANFFMNLDEAKHLLRLQAVNVDLEQRSIPASDPAQAEEDIVRAATVTTKERFAWAEEYECAGDRSLFDDDGDFDLKTKTIGGQRWNAGATKYTEFSALDHRRADDRNKVKLACESYFGNQKRPFSESLFNRIYSTLYRMKNSDAIKYLAHINIGFGILWVKPEFVQADSLLICKPSGFAHFGGTPIQSRRHDASDDSQNLTYLTTAYSTTSRQSLGGYPSIMWKNAAFIESSCITTDAVVDVTDKAAVHDVILNIAQTAKSAVERKTIVASRKADSWWPVFTPPIMDIETFSKPASPLGRMGTQFKDEKDFNERFYNPKVMDCLHPKAFTVNRTFSNMRFNFNTMFLYDSHIFESESFPLHKYMYYNPLGSETVSSTMGADERAKHPKANISRKDSDPVSGKDDSDLSALTGGAFPKSCWSSGDMSSGIRALADLKNADSYRTTGIITNGNTSFYVNGDPFIGKWDRCAVGEYSFTS